MEKVDTEIIPMPFPPYRRSHFRSHTYTTLLRILSHLSSSTVPDNGNVGMGQENQEKEPENSELKVGADVKDPKGPIPLKEIHDVHETIESVGDKGKDLSANAMVLDDAAAFLMGGDEQSTQTDGFHLEQTIMDELELVVKGDEDPVCDDSLIPLNCEKQNSGSEVDLMDYRVEHVEHLRSGTNTSESVSEVQSQVQGELNQLDVEGFNVSESTKGQASDSVISSTSSIQIERQQKETELVTLVCPLAGSIPTIQEGEFEKEEQYGHKVDEATHSSLDLDTNTEALNMTEDGGLLDSTILKDKCETQNEEKSEKLICVKNTTNSSDILIDEGDLEEGEISGEISMDGNTFDVSSADAIVSEQMKLDEIEKPGSSFENMTSPFNTGISFQGFPSNLFTVNAIQDTPTLTKNQVLRKGFMEETSHGNSSVVQIVDASRNEQSGPDPKKKKNKKMVDASGSKRGPGSQEKKTRKRKKYRKNKAEKNREPGGKRPKFIPEQKPKPKQCRHYMKGRCHEGDQCNFSHDAIPLTKSVPCAHYACGSCMKGNDCPYDHQLSKYPCSNFVSKGSCYRGRCMFSHQVQTSQDIPTPTNACKPELKSPLSSGNTNFSTPLNNHGTGSVQQTNSNSKGIYSHTNVEHKVTDVSQTKPTSAPKGIRFINVANLSPTTPKQDTVQPNKGNLVHGGTCADKGQNTVEISKKIPAVMPKGVNFLSFGKGSVCSFKLSIQSTAQEMILKLPQSVNFGLSEHSVSLLNKDDHGKAIDITAQNLPQTALFSHEISDKNQSMAERMKSRFLEKDSTDDSVRDHSHCKSAQEVNKASDNSQASTVTSATLLASPFVSLQSSEGLVSGCPKQASNIGQRALISTLAFAAEHESNIKMKCPTGASPV
ncbi:uncharacterized protein [Medicago truncatula]|uniref:uncharacterized protein isoform X4 n=1 Tax=Medicago truncatula TaxID=3880 RepID=UPI000D2F2E99|nr:uncharacterized protein LOC11437410 isoform X4 [Medicago truncatula]